MFILAFGLAVVAGCFSQIASAAAGAPMIAVTDLAYTQEVAEYFAAGKSKGSSNFAVQRNAVVGSSQSESTYVAGTYSYIEQRELGSFVGDIKGALLKGTSFRLVQGRTFDSGTPQPTKAELALNQIQTGKITPPVKQPEVKDIIARIRKGEFPNADYVLFGTLSNIQFVDEHNPVQGTTSATYIYGVDLVADFSLIDTRTYEIKGAFSAEGRGKDMRLLSVQGGSFTPNRSKVLRETSKTLATSVYEQLVDQLQIANPSMGERVRDLSGTAGSGRPSPPTGGSQGGRDETVILR